MAGVHGTFSDTQFVFFVFLHVPIPESSFRGVAHKAMSGPGGMHEK